MSLPSNFQFFPVFFFFFVIRFCKTLQAENRYSLEWLPFFCFSICEAAGWGVEQLAQQWNFQPRIRDKNTHWNNFTPIPFANRFHGSVFIPFRSFRSLLLLSIGNWMGFWDPIWHIHQPKSNVLNAETHFRRTKSQSQCRGFRGRIYLFVVAGKIVIITKCWASVTATVATVYVWHITVKLSYRWKMLILLLFFSLN